MVPAVIGTPSQNFVDQIYRDLLARPVDAPGLAFWSSQLDQGGTRTRVAQGLLHSSEYLSLDVQNLFKQILHRSPDAPSLAWGVGVRQSGGTHAQLETILLSSPEYFAVNGGNNDAFLTAVYRDLFTHTVDPSGRAGWDTVFNNGVSRSVVASLIVNGLENVQLQVAIAFQTYLQRSPDTDGLNFWTATVNQSGTDALVTGVLESPEYFTHASSQLPPNPSAPSIALTISAVVGGDGFETGINFNVTVSPPAGASGIPTGNVILTDENGHVLSTIGLVNGTGSSPVAVVLSAIDHKITATYSPVNSNFPSNQVTRLLTLNPDEDLANSDSDAGTSPHIFDDSTDRFILN